MSHHEPDEARDEQEWNEDGENGGCPVACAGFFLDADGNAPEPVAVYSVIPERFGEGSLAFFYGFFMSSVVLFDGELVLLYGDLLYFPVVDLGDEFAEGDFLWFFFW